MKASCSVWCVVVIAALLASVAVGQDAAMVVNTKPGQQQRGVRLGAPELRLTLKDATVMALEHNINIEVARLRLGKAGSGVTGATGIFDPLLKADGSLGNTETPSTSAISPSQNGRQFDLGVGQLLPTGANYTIGWANSRVEYSGAGSQSIFFINPTYRSGLSFSFTQPLLQGFGTDVNRTGIEIARRNRDISRLDFENLVVATIQSVESAYWNLVYQKDNLKVKLQSLKLAQDLLDQTRTRVRIGTSAPIDIVQSEATVAAREQEIIVADNAVSDAADQLKGLLGFENTDDWKSQIVPVDALEAPRMEAKLDEAIEEALSKRLELKQRSLEGEISEVSLLAAKNNTLPSLGLTLGYGLNGAGVTFRTDPGTGATVPVQGGWDDALTQIKDRDYRQWSAALGFSIPLGNHDAKARLAQARFDAAASRQNMALQRQGVIQEVRQSVRGLEASSKSIAAAEKARELAERNLDAEQKKFANGMSTNYQVLKIQEDLATAQAAELQSRVAYRVATVLYHVSVGNLLAQMGVQVTDEAPAREPHTLWKDVSLFKYSNYSKTEAEPQTAAAPAK